MGYAYFALLSNGRVMPGPLYGCTALGLNVKNNSIRMDRKDISAHSVFIEHGPARYFGLLYLLLFGTVVGGLFYDPGFPAPMKPVIIGVILIYCGYIFYSNRVLLVGGLLRLLFGPAEITVNSSGFILSRRYFSTTYAWDSVNALKVVHDKDWEGKLLCYSVFSFTDGRDIAVDDTADWKVLERLMTMSGNTLQDVPKEIDRDDTEAIKYVPDASLIVEGA